MVLGGKVMRGAANATLRAAAERVSAPILVPLVVVVGLLTLTFTTGVSWVVERENAARIAQTMRQVQELFGLEVAEDSAALDIALHGIVTDRDFAAPIRDRDRQRLLPLVPGRPLLLARAFFCLVEAAVDGGRTGRLAVSAVEGAGHWRIVFHDDGNGSSAARDADLAEARHVAELHGGDIVNAPVAGGRTVMLVLPAAE